MKKITAILLSLLLIVSLCGCSGSGSSESTSSDAAPTVSTINIAFCNNDRINPLDVHAKQLCQILCAYRIFLPFVGITVSSRESAEFRNGIVKIAATKISAGVSTGIGDHESKYTGKESEGEQGDEQFEINDNRSLGKMYRDISEEGLQPVLNDYLYV